MPRGGARPGAGRPKGSLNKATADVKALAQEHTDEALNKLVTLMRRGKTEAVKLNAAIEILNRGHGKPTQHHGNDPDSPLIDHEAWLAALK